jgi:hypothetical protein
MARDAGLLGDADDHSIGVAAIDRLALERAEHEPTGGALSAAGLQDPEHWHGQRHRRGLVALPDQVQDAVAAECFAVVLDAHGRCFGGPECVDAQQVGERSVVDADGLGGLEESDQFEPIKALGAGLVAMDLRKACVDGWVSRMSPSMWANRKNPRTPCIIVTTEESMSPQLPR